MQYVEFVACHHIDKAIDILHLLWRGGEVEHKSANAKVGVVLDNHISHDGGVALDVLERCTCVVGSAVVSRLNLDVAIECYAIPPLGVLLLDHLNLACCTRPVGEVGSPLCTIGDMLEMRHDMLGCTFGKAHRGVGLVSLLAIACQRQHLVGDVDVNGFVGAILVGEFARKLCYIPHLGRGAVAETIFACHLGCALRKKHMNAGFEELVLHSVALYLFVASERLRPKPYYPIFVAFGYATHDEFVLIETALGI